MANSKVTKGPSVSFASGGKSGKMTGKKSAVQQPGTTSPATKPSPGKFPMGGKGHMAGKGSASPAKPR